MVSLSLKINNLTVDEAKEIMETVRGIEQKNKDKNIFVQVHGMEDKSVKETMDVLKKIYPHVRRGGFISFKENVEG